MRMVDLIGIITKYCYSSEGKSAIHDGVKEVIRHGGDVGKFSLEDLESAAQVLSNEIAQAMPPALMGTYYASTSVSPSGDGWEIGVNIYDDDLYRPSLNPAKYGGVDNIYTLFIRGYDYTPKWGPQGIWHGRLTFALTFRTAKPFVENAVSSWVARYGGEYDILDWHVSSQYK